MAMAMDKIRLKFLTKAISAGLLAGRVIDLKEFANERLKGG